MEEAGRPFAPRGVKQCALLGIFLLHPNEVLASDRLLEDLWGGNPPGTGRTALAMQIWRLRKLLGEGGGALRFTPTVTCFTSSRTASTSTASRRDSQTETGYSRSVHSRPLLRHFVRRSTCGAGGRSKSWPTNRSPRLRSRRSRRIDCWHSRSESRQSLRSARVQELVAELELLVRQHPLREQFRCQLMLALYRSRRQAEALAVYQDTRRMLRDELGLDPSAALHDIQQAILRQETRLDRRSYESSCPPGCGGSPQRGIGVHPSSLRHPVERARSIFRMGGWGWGVRHHRHAVEQDLLSLAASTPV